MPLTLEGSLDLAEIPSDVASELRIHLKVRAAAGAAPAARPLVANLCILMDCSGSMAGAKVTAAVAAAQRIVEIVDERHRISLVGFASSSRVLVDNAQASAAGREALAAKIAQLPQYIGGATFLGSGIRNAADTVQRYAADARVVIVVSDGAADDKTHAVAQAERARELGIQLFAVGVGDDYEADHLRKLVTPSGGALVAPDGLDQLATVFGDLVTRIESFVATGARLGVTLADGVRARHLYKTLPQQVFLGDIPGTEMELRVGNVERGQTHAFLMTVVAPPGRGTRDIAQATLTYAGGEPQTVALRVAYGAELRPADVEISGAFRRAQIARLVDEVADAQRRSAKDEALERLDLLIRMCDEQGDERSRARYEQLREVIAGDAPVAQKAINQLVIASGDAAVERSGPIKQLYDVLLVAPGEQPILLLRALRELTGKSLRELNDLIAMTPAAVQEALPLRDAEDLVARLAATGVGATLKIKPR